MSIEENKLRVVLEGMGIEADRIDEAVKNIIAPQKPLQNLVSSKITDLEGALAATPPEDWRMRASIAARIISLRMDE